MHLAIPDIFILQFPFISSHFSFPHITLHLLPSSPCFSLNHTTASFTLSLSFLSVFFSVSLSVCLSVSLTVCLSCYLSTCLCVCLSFGFIFHPLPPLSSSSHTQYLSLPQTHPLGYIHPLVSSDSSNPSQPTHTDSPRLILSPSGYILL